MSDTPEIEVAPDCPNCHNYNTWGKHKLTREFDYEDANAFCKNCRTEFFVPVRWFSIDDWEDKVEIFE